MVSDFKLLSLLFASHYAFEIKLSSDSPVNTVVTTLTARTNEQTPDLLYAFIPPIEGFDINMNPLSNFTNGDRVRHLVFIEISHSKLIIFKKHFQELFKINGSNGIVQIKNSLNSERVPIWRSVIQVIERNSNPDLTATGNKLNLVQIQLKY